jgi:hydroxypyruvate reductase
MLSEIGKNVRAVVTGGALGASRALMERLPALEIVAINGVGTDAVDLAYARSRGIRVTTTPDVLTDDVADLAIGLMLAVSRRICEGDRYVRAGKWAGAALPLANKVSRKRLGILGLGRIGRAVARRAVGFDMQISYTSTSRVAEVPYRFVEDAVQLASESDILMVTVAGGAKSAGLVGPAVLEALGPKGILINVARGSVVDEKALVAALTSGRLGGAGLDVFADEPHVPEVLFQLENVVLQPHRASATVETRLAMGELVLANLAAHFAGGKGASVE